jgi:hypothetical protein
MEDSANNESTVSSGPDERKTLTKAELAEMLFERVGLNKREATSRNVPVVIRRPGKKSPSPPVAWSLSTPARS